jgi:tetratricopeptide (TPR) repeat protein
MRRPLAVAAILMLALTAAARAADPKILLIKGENLTVLGDAAARDLRATAVLLDQFRSAVALVLPSARHLTVPTNVFVFKEHKAMQPFLPLYNGKPADVGGIFMGSSDINYIAVSAAEDADDEEATRTILHEYTHLLQNAATKNTPPWFAEGMAEYFSTFRMDGKDERRAVMGRVVATHVELLREQFLPLETVLAVTHDSPMYNDDGKRRGVFYAESWATIHYILAEVPNPAVAINRYLTTVESGGDPVGTFEALFGSATEFGRRVQEYVRRVGFRSYSYTLPAAPQVQQASDARALSPSEAQARLGALQVRAGRLPEGKARIDAAVAGPTPSAQAYEALGHLQLRQQRQPDALVAFRKAAALDPDDFSAQYFFGMLLLQHGSDAAALGIADPDDAARAALARAVQLNPLAGDAFEGLSVACMRLGRWPEARAAVLQATALAPGRLEYAYQLAEIDFGEGNTAAARTRLAMLVAAAPNSDVGKIARAQLARLGDPRSNGPAARPPAPAAVPLPPDDTGAAPAPSSTSFTSRSASALDTSSPYAGFQLRKVQAGETRSLATITNIECARDAVIRIHVTVDGKAMVATAVDLGKVDLVTFRTGMAGIACGPRPRAEQIYLTYRPLASGPAGDVVGEAVAIEFLPSDYVSPVR